MTAALQRVAAELKKLSPGEVDALAAWLSDYQRTLHQPAAVENGGAAAWPDFSARAREFFPDGPPAPSFLETLLEARSARF